LGERQRCSPNGERSGKKKPSFRLLRVCKVNGEKPSRLRHLRPIGAILSLGAVAIALYPVWFSGSRTHLWHWMGAALGLAVVWQIRLPLPGSALDAGVERSTRRRRLLGMLLAAGGAVLWAFASYALFRDWEAHFDLAWLGWLIGAGALAVGLDVFWDDGAERRTGRRCDRSPCWLSGSW